MSAAITELTLPSSPIAIRKTKAPHEGELKTVRCVVDTDEELDIASIHREFPTVAFERSVSVGRTEPHEVVLDDFAWRGAFDFLGFDEKFEAVRPLRRLTIRGVDATGVAMEVLSRYQRVVGRRNAASSTNVFSKALLELESLWKSGRAEHRLDMDHAVDTWQWVLRLQPDAGLALQVAALFHDAARSEGSSHDRLEHRAHRLVDDDVARRGGHLARAMATRIGLTECDVARVERLIVGGDDKNTEAALLDDAESLSFLSLMSAQYADHFGLAQTRRKVAFMMGRLGEAALVKVGMFRIRPDVARLL